MHACTLTIGLAMASRSSSTRWKPNKLLSSFVKSKGKRKGSNPQHHGAKKHFKSAFSLLPQAMDTVPSTPSDSFPESHSPDHELELQDPIDYCSDDDNGDSEQRKPGSQQRRTHQGMMTKQLESWKNAQAELLNCYAVDKRMPTGQLCMDCANVAQFRCKDCSSIAFYCEDCCVLVHRYNNIYHFPEKWVNGSYSLAPLKNVFVPLTHECTTSYQQKITVISLKG